MSSTNKTENLKLNQWLGTDKPTRLDYVQDNLKIDTAFAAHTDDAGLHMSTDEKNKLNNPYITFYGGDGGASRVISFPFTPRLVVVYKRATGFVSHTGSKVLVNAAIGSASGGCSGGISMAGTSAITYQSSAAINNNEWFNLNESGSQYGVLAFR